jgi:hypothetical protein
MSIPVQHARSPQGRQRGCNLVSAAIDRTAPRRSGSGSAEPQPRPQAWSKSAPRPTVQKTCCPPTQPGTSSSPPQPHRPSCPSRSRPAMPSPPGSTRQHNHHSLDPEPDNRRVILDANYAISPRPLLSGIDRRSTVRLHSPLHNAVARQLRRRYFPASNCSYRWPPGRNRRPRMDTHPHQTCHRRQRTSSGPIDALNRRQILLRAVARHDRRRERHRPQRDIGPRRRRLTPLRRSRCSGGLAKTPAKRTFLVSVHVGKGPRSRRRTILCGAGWGRGDLGW